MLIRINKRKLKCPTCGAATLPAINGIGGDSTDWMRCSKPHCETYIDTYIPLDFQAKIHSDPHRYIGIFGGYGSGKTKTGEKDDGKHILSTPGGRTVVGSAVLSQVEGTFESDFLKNFPEDFIAERNKTKKTYKMINGHELLIKSYYEPNLLRSLDVSRFHIVEASEVEFQIFTELTTRLRNTNGTIPELTADGDYIWDDEKETFKFKADWRRGLIESNPDPGWIRGNFLLKSCVIYNYSNIDQKYFVDSPQDTISSHIIPTSANKYLPPTFERDISANKPAWWTRRYLKGSFDYAEGMVYPEAMTTFKRGFVPPNNWKRVIGMDYGIRDATCILFGAIDHVKNVLHIFHEIYINNVDYKVISALYRKTCSDLKFMPLGSLFRSPVMDGRSINKRNDRDLVTIGELFAEEGIYFEAAQMNLDARILKTNTMINAGQLEIHDTCPNLMREIKDYKFPERSLEASLKDTDEKPTDKKNHAINALEFICMEVPHDMSRVHLHAYHGTGKVMEAFTNQIRIQKSQRYNPFEDDRPVKRFDPDEIGDYGQIYEGGSSW